MGKRRSGALIRQEPALARGTFQDGLIMLVSLALAATAAQVAMDEPLVWNQVEGSGHVPGAPSRIIGSVGDHELVFRVGDELMRYLPDGTLTWRLSVVGAQSVAILEDGGYATAAVIDEMDPAFPAVPGAGGDDVGVVVFDAQGAELWRRRFGGMLDEHKAAVVADELGGVYVLTERRDPSLGPTWANGVQLLEVARLDSDGGVLWTATTEVTFSEYSHHYDHAAAHPDHGLVLLTHETSPYDSSLWDPFVTRFRPDGHRVYRTSDAPLVGNVVFDQAGAIYAAYDRYDLASSVSFRGVASYGATGVPRWFRGHCGASVTAIDDDGWLWVASEEVPNSSSCTYFDDPEVRRFLAVDPADGQVVQRVDLPTVASSPTVAVFTMTRGGHAYFEAATGSQPIRARLSWRHSGSVATCAGAANSTGAPGLLLATGAEERAIGDLTIFANGLPVDATTMFIAGFAGGFVPGAGGSEGNLCISGHIGRYSGASEVRVASASGRAALALDLDRIPTPGGPIVLLAGQTIHFQAWYRDATPLPTSNFTSAVAVTLQ